MDQAIKSAGVCLPVGLAGRIGKRERVGGNAIERREQEWKGKVREKEFT